MTRRSRAWFGLVDGLDRDSRLVGAIAISVVLHLSTLGVGRVGYYQGAGLVVRGQPIEVTLRTSSLPTRDAERNSPTAQVASNPDGAAAVPDDSGSELRGEADANSTAGSAALNLPYFRISMLDVPPQVVGYGVPVLSKDDDPLRVGQVSLRVSLAFDGRLSELVLVDAGGLPASFVRSAEDAIRRTRFKPGLLAGNPVPVQFTVVVKFGQD